MNWKSTNNTGFFHLQRIRPLNRCCGYCKQGHIMIKHGIQLQTKSCFTTLHIQWVVAQVFLVVSTNYMTALWLLVTTKISAWHEKWADRNVSHSHSLALKWINIKVNAYKTSWTYKYYTISYYIWLSTKQTITLYQHRLSLKFYRVFLKLVSN